MVWLTAQYFAKDGHHLIPDSITYINQPFKTKGWCAMCTESGTLPTLQKNPKNFYDGHAE